jgi:5-methylcytosine-specific restriction endonuclease McrA
MRSIRSFVSTLIGFAGPRGTSRPRTSSGWRSSKGSSGKETRPSGDRQVRVRWAPSDGPASDRRPLAQMAPAPSEPRATTFSSRGPAVHRPFGLFVAAADLLVPAQVARPRAPDPRAARTDRGSRESVEAGAVTLRLCLHCGRHYHSGTGVRARASDCGRAYDRELSRQKRARRTRNSAAWQKARAAAKQRDGNRCVNCGATEGLQVHHVVRLEDGGAEFDLNNLVTLCVGCHGEQHRGIRARRTDRLSHPQLAIGEKHRTTMKPHSSEPSRKHSTRGFASCQRG